MSHLGVLCLHGLGGTPHSVLPLTAASHGAGYQTVAPKLPGHGSAPADLIDIDWADLFAGVVDVAESLASRVEGIAVVGQSMGATLALQLATERDFVRGVAAINPVVLPADVDATEHLQFLLERGSVMQPAGDPDLRDPGAHDSAYIELPVHALLQLGVGAGIVHDRLDRISVPLLVVSSDHDAVVDPANADELAARARGPVTRLHLPNSGHVAALDLDRELLCEQLLTWLAGLTDESGTAG